MIYKYEISNAVIVWTPSYKISLWNQLLGVIDQTFGVRRTDDN